LARRAVRSSWRALDPPPTTCGTPVSLLLAQGVPARVVMEILGHTQIAVTMDIYSHVRPAMQSDAAERMNDALG
jgi:integrase